MTQRYFLCATAVVMIIIGSPNAGSARRPYSRDQAPSISGSVFDATGQPLPGVTVIVMPEAGGTVARARSEANGVYQVGALPEGTYRVDFDLPGFDVGRRNHIRVVAGTPAEVDLALFPRAICECIGHSPRPTHERDGRVVDESGRPLPHARLELVGELGNQVAYADADGWFRVRIPAGGEASLLVSDSGFRTNRQTVAGTSTTAPVVVPLAYSGTASLPSEQRLTRGCRCPDDSFTHDGR